MTDSHNSKSRRARFMTIRWHSVVGAFPVNDSILRADSNAPNMLASQLRRFCGVILE